MVRQTARSYLLFRDLAPANLLSAPVEPPETVLATLGSEPGGLRPGEAAARLARVGPILLPILLLAAEETRKLVVRRRRLRR